MHLDVRTNDSDDVAPGDRVIHRLAWVLLHQVVGRGSVFAFFALLPLWLPLEAAGAFALAYSTMQMVFQPAFDTAVNTMLVRAVARGDWTTVGRVVQWTLALLGVLLTAGVAAVATAGVAPLWSWLAGYFALSLPLNMAFAICRGRGRFDVEGIVGSLQKLSLLPLLWATPASASAPAQALFLSAIFGWTVFATGFGPAWRGERAVPPVQPAGPFIHTAPLRETLYLTALAAAALLYLRIDLVLLGAFSGLRDVGVYATASRWMEAAFVLPVGFMLVLFPRLSSRPFQSGELRFAFRLFSTVAVVTFAGSLAVAWFLIPVVYRGAVGQQLARLVLLLSPCAIAVCFGTLFSQTLVAWGRTPLALAAALVGLGAKLTIAGAAIPRMGTTGAALASVGTEVAVAVASAVLLRRVMHEQRPVHSPSGSPPVDPIERRRPARHTGAPASS
ncbi:MAG: lipopolysaccharide biosynthesis protein [Vicinamibacterales bacterium]